MRIKWQIKKKRGNFRPTLNYTITLESFEKNLAIHSVGLETQIPELPSAHKSYCLPGENERHPLWSPKRFHWIQVPYFKTGRVSEFIRLPFRESRDYPEVEESFRELRRIYEEKVCEAYGQSPFEQNGSLDITPSTQKKVAARVTADRLMGLFGMAHGKEMSDKTPGAENGFFPGVG